MFTFILEKQTSNVVILFDLSENKPEVNNIFTLIKV